MAPACDDAGEVLFQEAVGDLGPKGGLGEEAWEGASSGEAIYNGDE